MSNIYTTQPEIRFSEAPVSPQKPEVMEKVLELTTLEAIDGAENLPRNIVYEFGTKITEKILKGTGSLEICVGDRGLVVIPETHTVLIPAHSGPYAERWLRSPWQDAIANFEDSFLTLKIVPATDIKTARRDGGLDSEDVEGLTVERLQKDSTVNLKGIFGDDLNEIVDRKT